jgi:membrane fusion protein (multidrug efflux system)
VPAVFSQTLRSLDADRPRGRWLAVLLFVLLGVWVAWMALARVAVYETTDRARLEVVRSAHVLSSSVAGRVVESRLLLGRGVTQGEPLVVLDSRSEELARVEKETRIASLRDRAAALDREILSEQDALAAQEKARTLAAAEAKAQLAKSEAAARLADEDLARVTRLRQSGAASDSDYRKAVAEADTARAGLRAANLAAQRGEQDRGALEAERKARIARLQRDKLDLTGETAVETAAVARLTHEIDRRIIPAPVTGRIGELTARPPGTLIQPGEPLATIVPPGEPRAVAHFPPVVIGRIQPGQRARLRLAGFPWTQYGTVPATVAGVGNEPKDGLVRVELALQLGEATTVPLEHGLTGSVEVEVESVSPAVLLVRAAGQALGVRRPTPEPRP